MQPKVVTIGLGYIGLPTPAMIAQQNVPLFGVDINQEVVDTINRGEIHIVEPKLDDIDSLSRIHLKDKKIVNIIKSLNS